MLDAGIEDLIARALAEDVGAGDLTTEAVVEPGTRARARIEQKAPGVVFGLDVAEAVFRRLDPRVSIERRRAGGRVAGGAARDGADAGGRRARAADRRAHGAELPRAPVGHRDRHGRCGRGAARAPA